MNRTLRSRASRAWARTATGIATTVTIAVTTTACGGAGGGSESAPGVTGDTIKIGSTQPLTGPVAPGYAKMSKAMAAYFNYVNDNGGVHGRSIDFVVEDDGYNPTKTAEKTRKLVLKDKVFALVGAFGTAPHTAVLDFIRQNKVPDLFPSSGSVSWNQPDIYPDTFGWQTDYIREGKVLASYVKENFAGKTVCAFGQGDDLGADGVKGVETVLGKDGLKASEAYTATNPDVKAQIGKLQASGCEVVVSFSSPGFTALALGTSAKLGFKAQWVVVSIGSDPVGLTGYLKDDAAALTNGLISSTFLPLPTDADNSWIKLFTTINNEYNEEQGLDSIVLYGYALAYSAVEALQAAGKDLTREGLLKVLGSGDLVGPGLTPFAFSADDHSGFIGTAMTRITDLKAEIISPVYVTDDGDGPVEKYDGVAPQAPKGGISK
ncbi:ABC transporter substrate-binding protein [Nocardioides currus]|uniref:ABC transporter substrate-binding protein n=1 Tax=Nocardioides currus TaxID=2133958 RepID=A0A2R7YXH5_9ACTN|nr:ABC transporter substrate-binding protein [Nocardioides currus]PUA81072.1 ABC transporter substrate-binding protein [Nocardioides currus]